MSIDGWMDKQNVVYTYNEILFSLKKEGNCDIYYQYMDEPWRNYAKQNKSVKKGQIMYDSTYEIPRVVKFLETESRMVIVRGWRKGVVGS